jgi:hypothetical protein
VRGRTVERAAGATTYRAVSLGPTLCTMPGAVELLVPVVSVIGGATIGFLPSYLQERRRERAALLTRWDATLYDLCAEFTSAVRALLFLAERTADGKETPPQETAHGLDSAQLRIRTAYEQIRLLGSSDLQRAADTIRHHGYAVRMVAEGIHDPHVGEPGSAEPPTRRLRGALPAFYAAARTQLRVQDPEDVVAERSSPNRTTS